MNTQKSFDIYVIRKVPYMVSAILVIAMLCALCIFLEYGVTSSDSPGILFRSFVFAALMLIISYPLYKITRRKKRGRLIFQAETLDVVLLKERKAISLASVRKIVCRDPENKNGLPNKKFGIRIETQDGLNLDIRLKRTRDIRAFTAVLLSYESLNLEYSHHILWN